MFLAEPRDVSPEAAVPPGRLAYDLHAPSLLLRGFVAPAVWDVLTSADVVRFRAVRVEHEAIDPFAYGWMATRGSRAARRRGARLAAVALDRRR